MPAAVGQTHEQEHQPAQGGCLAGIQVPIDGVLKPVQGMMPGPARVLPLQLAEDWLLGEG